MDKLMTALENAEPVIGIFVIFLKAFDTFDHGIFPSYHYGIRWTA